MRGRQRRASREAGSIFFFLFASAISPHLLSLHNSTSPFWSLQNQKLVTMVRSIYSLSLPPETCARGRAGALSPLGSREIPSAARERNNAGCEGDPPSTTTAAKNVSTEVDRASLSGPLRPAAFRFSFARSIEETRSLALTRERSSSRLPGPA